MTPHEQGVDPLCVEDMGSGPCGRPAVGIAFDETHGGYYPVCDGHMASGLENAGAAPQGSDVDREPPTRLSADELDELAAEVAKRAAPVFAAADWRYLPWRDDPGKVPDEARLKKTVADLIESAGGGHVFDGGSAGSGRFQVTREIEEGENTEWCTVVLQVGQRIAVPNGFSPAGSGAEPEEGHDDG